MTSDVDPRTSEIAVGPFVFDALEAGPVDGAPVLLLHGFPESMYEWTEVMARLAARGHRTVAFNQRGYSSGARPDGVESYHHSLLVDDALGVADALGVDRFHLVGHDWGALVAWSLAAYAPDRLRSLSILSVPHPRAFADARENDADQRERSAYIAWFKSDAGAAATFLADGAAGLHAALAEVEPDTRDRHVEVLSAPGAMDGALNYYRAWDESLDEIEAIEVPTLFVWSDEDIAIARSGAVHTHEFVHGPYRFVELTGRSHWLPEVAADEVAELIAAHIEDFD